MRFAFTFCSVILVFVWRCVYKVLLVLYAGWCVLSPKFHCLTPIIIQVITVKSNNKHIEFYDYDRCISKVRGHRATHIQCIVCVCVFFVGTKNEKCSIEVITDASIELHSLFELKYHLVFGDGQWNHIRRKPTHFPCEFITDHMRNTMQMLLVWWALTLVWSRVASRSLYLSLSPFLLLGHSFSLRAHGRNVIT